MSSPKQSSLIQLFQPTQYVPMRDLLYKALDVRSIIRLAQTSKDVREMIQSDKALWNINKRLARFFDDSIAFRSQLGLCDGLIAGSFPLQFFENVHWPDSDIDIYVKWGESTNLMHSYLINDGKYSQSPSEHLSETEYGGYETTNPHGDVIEVRTYFKKTETSKLKVQLIATQNMPWQAVIRNYYMSCICNFITWNKAYSLYPKSTFIEHKTFPLLPLRKRWDDLYQIYFEKYGQRGWTKRVWLPPPGEPGELFSARQWTSSGSLPAIQRRVGDRYSWIMNLDTEGVTPSVIPDSVVQCSGFEITAPKMRRNHGLWWYCKIQADPFECHGLKYSYTRCKTPAWKKVATKASKHAKKQWNKIPIEEQSRLAGKEGSNESSLSTDGKVPIPECDFQKPDEWTFIDEQLPAIFQE